MTTKPKRAYPKVVASVGDSLKIHVSGREAEALMMLVSSPFRRVEAYDFRGGPPFRLGAYVFDIRRMGLTIRTERVEHGIGWHAAYVLETPVTIVAVDDGQPKGQIARKRQGQVLTLTLRQAGLRPCLLSPQAKVPKHQPAGFPEPWRGMS